MIVHKELEVCLSEKLTIIYFGEADTDNELQELFKLRYLVYKERGYIDSEKYSNCKEIDEYDIQKKCNYYLARIDNKIIGCIRLIQDHPLPTEKHYSFNEPFLLKNVPVSERFELGRFIIVPPNSEMGNFLPRGLVMTFLLHIIAEDAKRKGLRGGYSFVKKSLIQKMERRKMPFKKIEKYLSNISINDPLYPYFTDTVDPVIPIYFMTEDFLRYTGKIIASWIIFRKINSKKYELRSNWLTKLLLRY